MSTVRSVTGTTTSTGGLPAYLQRHRQRKVEHLADLLDVQDEQSLPST